MVSSMLSQARKNLKEILHPYVFVLKEGGTIKDNFLDYSLMILQVTAPETIKSPLRRRIHAIPSKRSLSFVQKKSSSNKRGSSN